MLLFKATGFFCRMEKASAEVGQMKGKGMLDVQQHEKKCLFNCVDIFVLCETEKQTPLFEMLDHSALLPATLTLNQSPVLLL